MDGWMDGLQQTKKLICYFFGRRSLWMMLQLCVRENDFPEFSTLVCQNYPLLLCKSKFLCLFCKNNNPVCIQVRLYHIISFNIEFLWTWKTWNVKIFQCNISTTARVYGLTTFILSKALNMSHLGYICYYSWINTGTYTYINMHMKEGIPDA